LLNVGAEVSAAAAFTRNAGASRPTEATIQIDWFAIRYLLKTTALPGR
jgi:hypothetical protein